MDTSITLIYEKQNKIDEVIQLPLSKSLSNRLMMIYALNNWDDSSIIYSDADDSILLKYLLSVIARNENADFEDEPLSLNCKNAGTVIRFLTPYLCDKKQSFILTGSQRMKSRPIGPLVDALNDLGADIRYMENEGFPPLCVKTTSLKYNDIHLDVGLSSQFASALLLMLPLWFSQSKIVFEGEVSSKPYIDMTLKLMSYYGVSYHFKNNEITLTGRYALAENQFNIEADWSSASYWYQTLALLGKGKFFLPDLNLNSLQGDVALAHIFTSLGVKTYQKKDGVLLVAEGEINYHQTIDFKDIPDLAPSVINTCAGLGVMGKFSGLESLNHKESRRMDVLCAQLDKLGFDLRSNGFGEYVLINSCKPKKKTLDFSNIEIQTYNDHRMAMAFAPMAAIGKSIHILDANSVFKSYPFFWHEIGKIFKVV